MPMQRRGLVDAYIRSSRPRFEEMLGRLVELPSVSSDPARAGVMTRTAAVAAQSLRELGAQARIVRTKGCPVVSGGWQAGARCPTLTIYNHLDVQPALEPEWRHDPFTFRKQGTRYHGRGATDDKGPALTALFAARYAAEQGLPLNLRFLWELEEEIGSPNFEDALAQDRAVPRPDSVLVSDTIWVSRRRPAIATGLRGLVAARLTLRTGSTDAHSGVTGGGARNPLAELCDAVHACVDARTGRVKIPGFYDAALPPTDADVKQFLSSGFQVSRFKRAHGLRAIRTEHRADLLTRLWASPTFEVHGLAGGHHGPGVKTAVPPAGALLISMRLVPRQRPAAILALLKAHLRRHNPDIRVREHGLLEPFRGVTQGPYARALSLAVRAGFGARPSLVREGGSIGAVAMMARAWNAPILLFGLSLPEHGYHAPNEYFDWGQASGGMRAFVDYFSRVAALPRSRP